MSVRKVMGSLALALLGIALTAGVTIATSSLVRQPIGLGSEPLTAGDRLAPERHAARTNTHKRRRHKLTRHSRTPPHPSPPPPATAPPRAPRATPPSTALAPPPPPHNAPPAKAPAPAKHGSGKSESDDQGDAGSSDNSGDRSDD